jgi:hypothetical protein
MNYNSSYIYRKGVHARGQAARQYNRALKEVQFDEGERVLLFHPPGQVEQGRKLRNPWLGPYRVKEKLSPIGYVLESEISKEVARVHVNRMRRLDPRRLESSQILAEWP